MFGQNDTNQQVATVMTQQTAPAVMGVPATSPITPTPMMATAPVLDDHTTPVVYATDQSANPISTDIGAPLPIDDLVTSVESAEQQAVEYTETPVVEQMETQESVTPVTSAAAPEETSNLQAIKAEAIEELAPLVSYLDQTAEEKFHTTMMLLQATDDQSLIKVAYEAAHAIEDEKAKAQALLDVVNEINYFTQVAKGA